jgi:hypothetical protein
MPSFRISLAALMAIIAVIALGLAGMMSASSLWTASAASVTLALLLAAILSAGFSDGADRSASAGFALFGWTYLLLVNWDWVGGQFGHDLTAGLSEVAEAIFAEVKSPPPSSTTTALALKAIRYTPVKPGPSLPPPPPSTVVTTYYDYLQITQQRQTKIGNFVQIARMLLALLFALLGGFLGRALARRRESRPEPAGQAGTR